MSGSPAWADCEMADEGARGSRPAQRHAPLKRPPLQLSGEPSLWEASAAPLFPGAPDGEAAYGLSPLKRLRLGLVPGPALAYSGIPGAEALAADRGKRTWSVAFH